ncbi:MAG: hypothetical protein JXA67_08090 [Micromonosporaceae bacterium]|nr:hypothetical protein [Micromonosporaceae bacterium]
MSELAVITPTFHADAELFVDLHRSVLEYTPPETVHHVFVPPTDLGIFGQYAGPRCRVWANSELMPRRYLRLSGSNDYLNLTRPWPPVRGWVTQQAVKITAASQLAADIVLIVDSDVVLVRPIQADDFRAGGRPILHREEQGVTASMERHVIWHRVARELLGLGPSPQPPLPDYVAGFGFWQPSTVRALQERVAETTRRNWLDAFTSRLHISEFILYGVYVDEVVHAGNPLPGDITKCYNTWQRTPLDHTSAMEFAEGLPQEAVAVMISAKSRTPADIRRAAFRRCAEIVAAG